MLRPSDEERLSAYFDEELSSEERAEAECLLREDPAARDWLDQLGDLHAELQLLPRLRLPGDFADGVLRRAEREMLLADGAHERASLEPDAAHGQNGAASHVPFPLTALATESGNGSVSQQPSRGELADRELRPTLSQLAGEFSRETAEPPTLAPRAARPGSDPAARWNAPSWLAAAASLLLFAGVLTLGTGERNWAKTATPSPGERTAQNNTAQSKPDGGEKARLARRSEETAGRNIARSMSEKAAGGGVPPTDAAEGSAGTSASRTFGDDLGAERAAEKRPGLPQESSTGPVARSKGGANLPEADEAYGDSYQSAPLTDGAQAPLPGVAAGAGGGGFGGPMGPVAGFARSPPGASKSGFVPTAEAPTRGGGTFAFFATLSPTRAAANGPASNGLANNRLANVVVVDVDGAPAEAFARIEEALLLRREVADAKDRMAGKGKSAPAKSTNAAPATSAAKAMSTIRLRDVFDKEVLDQMAAGRPPTEKGTDQGKGNGKEKGEENRTALFDAVPARVYFVDLPPEELARTLRDVAVVARGKGDVAVTNLGTLAEPLPEGQASLELGESSRPRDRRSYEALGLPGGGPRIGAESEEQRRELADPIAVDKKSLLKSAEEPSERKEKREQDRPARHDLSRQEPPRAAPGASAKFAAPAAKPAPAKLAAGKEALRFAEDSPVQPAPAQPAMSLSTPASPRTTTAAAVPTMRVPTIIVVRVNPPSRPAAPAAAPVAPSK